MNLTNSPEWSGSKFIYFYLPYSFYLKAGKSIKAIELESAKTGPQAENVLWPRSGSTTIQNANGNAYMQLDANDILLSTGFEDLEEESIEVMNTRLHEFKRFNGVSQLDSMIYMSKYDRIFEEKMFAYFKALYELDNVDTSKLDAFIESLAVAKSFEERIGVLFGISFSNPNYEYYDTPEIDDEDRTKDSGVVIGGKTIYLTNLKKEQTRYSAARGDRVVDLMAGIINHITDLHKVIKSHKHLGTPSSVLTPDPNTMSGIDELDSSLNELTGKLSSILSTKIIIP